MDVFRSRSNTEPADGKGKVRRHSWNRSKTDSYGTISRFIVERLENRNEGIVIRGIEELLRKNPDKEKRVAGRDACIWLVGFIKMDKRKKVVKTATTALITLLKKHKYVDSKRMNSMVAGHLNEKNSKNLELFREIILECGISEDLRFWAIGQLAEYKEQELGPAKVDEIEFILLERMMDLGESDEIQRRIRDKFRRDERPRIGKSTKEDETIRLELPVPEEHADNGSDSKIEMATMAILADVLKNSEGEPENKAANSLYKLAMRSERIKVVGGAKNALETKNTVYFELWDAVNTKLNQLIEAEKNFRNRVTLPPPKSK